MLKNHGKTILYISHRLKEIFDITVRLSVLRDGKYVGTENTSDMTGDKVVRMMIGRDVSSYYTAASYDVGNAVMEVKGLSKQNVFEDISFNIKKGEILGFAGLMGSGREEIIKSLYGLIHADSGRVILDGSTYHTKSPKHAMKQGVAFLTDDRKNEGIFEQMSVKENLSISIISQLCKMLNLYIDDKKENEHVLEYTNFMNIKYADKTQKMMFLSGGNQQKVILSRAIAGKCKVLLLLEPTRGIDVGAKAEIYTLLHKLAAQGVSIIVVSSELPEIISICNRTIVIWQGMITGELNKEVQFATNYGILCLPITLMMGAVCGR